MSQAQVVGLLRWLIGFDTTAGRPNRDLIRGIASYLGAQGAQLVEVPSPRQGMSNLVCTFGPPAPGGILFCAHTDVVAVDGQSWTSDPWSLMEREDGCLVGRGACDMKGAIAVLLSLATDFQMSRLRRPIHLALSHSEELGCVGAFELAPQLDRLLPPLEAALVVEPTMMQVVGEQRSSCVFRTSFIGGEAAAPGTRNTNANHYAGRFLSWLADRHDQLEAIADAAGTGGGGGTIVNAQRVLGGSALFSVSSSCHVDWTTRTPASEDPFAELERAEHWLAGALLPEMRARCPNASISTSTVSAVPGMVMDKNRRVVDLAIAWSGRPYSCTGPNATEAGVYSAAGIPSVVCGPGSLFQAHEPDEHIPIAQLQEFEAFVRRIRNWAVSEQVLHP